MQLVVQVALVIKVVLVWGAVVAEQAFPLLQCKIMALMVAGKAVVALVVAIIQGLTIYLI